MESVSFIEQLFCLSNILVIVDGKRPALAFAVTGGKVLLHSPHDGRGGDENPVPTVRYLNFNKKITALHAGIMKFNLDEIVPHNVFVRLFV